MDTIKKKVLESLEMHKGIVTKTCESLSMPRSTYYLWLNEDEEFKAAVDEIQNVAIDYVESKLFERIDGVLVDSGKTDEGLEPIIYKSPPSDTAIIFYLKTKGKKRGYVERQELTGPDGSPLNISFHLDKDSEPLNDE